jgi:hypothetical protein
MKTNSRSFKRLLLIGSSCGLVGVTVVLTAGKSPGKYAAHEWGTFTSVQGTDGVLLQWRPLESSVLPKFVYNWQHPGLNRQSGTLASLLTKESMVTLQRMETPVIYFYSAEPRTVDEAIAPGERILGQAHEEFQEPLLLHSKYMVLSLVLKVVSRLSP